MYISCPSDCSADRDATEESYSAKELSAKDGGGGGGGISGIFDSMLHAGRGGGLIKEVPWVHLEILLLFVVSPFIFCAPN